MGLITIDQVREYLTATKSPVQLVKHYDEVPKSKLKWPALAQIKYDGVYCMIVCLGGTWYAFSRTGKEYTNVLRYLGTWGDSTLREGMVYIGELVNSKLSLEQLSGAVNPNRVEPLDQTTDEAMLEFTRLYVHDAIGVEALLAGVSNTPYNTRSFNAVGNKLGNIFPVRSHWMNDEAQWLQFADNCVELGYEGAVLKQAEEPWVAGHKGYRTTKIVRGMHVDLVCTGVVKGTGKFNGLIAGLCFAWKGKPFTAGLGKGWDTAYQQHVTDMFYRDYSSVVGKVWHVSALQESSQGVLRLPKVNELRVDKDTSD